MYISVQLSHFAVQQKLTQHCKSILLYFNKKNKKIKRPTKKIFTCVSRGKGGTKRPGKWVWVWVNLHFPGQKEILQSQ